MATATDSAGGAPTPVLMGELKALIIDRMSRRLERMFDGADNLLLSMSERSRNSDEQRRYFDTRHLVRRHKPALAKVFQDELAAAFVPGAKKKPETPEVSFEELRMAKTRTIEECIAVNNIATKVEAENEQTLFELGRRMDYLVQERGVATSPLALAPGTLCNAFRISTQSLNLDLQYELIMYKLFDKLVASALNEVYVEALQLLEQRGGITATVLRSRPVVTKPLGGGRPPTQAFTAAPSPSSGASGAFPSMPDGAAIPAGAFAPTPQGGAVPAGAFAPMPQGGGGTMMPAPGPMTGSLPALDPRTFEALRARGPLAPSAANYGDAELATELSQLASGQAVAGWSAPQARANIQCADLVGKMFNGILEDVGIVPELKPQLDGLRFEVIKAALADRSFFSRADHPLRKLVHELGTMAATARAMGAGSVGQMVSAMPMIQSQFQVAAHAARNAAATAAPLADGDAERFLDDQLIQAKARRQALIDKARQVVREELQVRLAGRTLPDEPRPLLMAGISPLLGLRLLRQGMDSNEWRSDVVLLEKTIDALDPAITPAADAPTFAQLCAEIEHRLLEAGMLASRVAELVAGLRQGLETAQRRRQARAAEPPAPAPEVPPPPPPPPPERPIELLLRLLVPGEWFKVRDSAREQTRWLKVAAHYLGDERAEFRDRVAFAEFSGQNALLVPVDELLGHIVTGQTVPFDQSPAARATLKELIEKQQAFMAATAAVPAPNA